MFFWGVFRDKPPKAGEEVGEGELEGAGAVLTYRCYYHYWIVATHWRNLKKGDTSLLTQRKAEANLHWKTHFTKRGHFLLGSMDLPGGIAFSFQHDRHTRTTGTQYDVTSNR